jgi:hypothetical protein
MIPEKGDHMLTYDDWKSKHVWKVIDLSSDQNDILTFSGNGLPTGSNLVSRGKLTVWGTGCKYCSGDKVEVIRASDSLTYTIQRSTSAPFELSCTMGGSSFTATESKEVTTAIGYNSEWTPTRLWKVKSPAPFFGLDQGDILIFTGLGDGSGELKLSKDLGAGGSWGSSCTYIGPAATTPPFDHVELMHKGWKHTITRILSGSTVQLKCVPPIGIPPTGSSWTAEEGG